jgi:hypothetical protein
MKPAALGISIANVAVGFWGYFYPQPYGLCMVFLISIPWLAIPAARPIESRKPLAYTLVFPLTALLCRATNDIETFTLIRGVLIGTGAGALVLGIVFLVSRKVLQSFTVIVLAIVWCYGFGTTLELNTLLDSPNTKRTSVAIISRDYHIGRYSTFELVLAPWGERLRNNRATISWNTYVSLRGQTLACVNSGPGAVGIRWYQVERCR